MDTTQNTPAARHQMIATEETIRHYSGPMTSYTAKCSGCDWERSYLSNASRITAFKSHRAAMKRAQAKRQAS